ncbi:MAG: g-D-glutamyl-meso-diaminopimelate peptidase [Patescibacteria group bacterium]|nr:g-D-glutamyl-meso-diaminopimelate peptidase [Patescibacteria group bacterium]
MLILLLSKIKLILKGLYESLEGFAEIPKSLAKFPIGLSHLKNPIDCYRIGNGEIKILFVSGVHGNEVGTVKLSYKLLNFLNKKYLDFPEITFYVIPCLNPDGFLAAKKNKDFINGGKVGRFNNKNVDLNRNFNTPSFKKESLWSFGKKYSQNIKVNCGDEGNSEPEIQAIIKFIETNNIKFIFSFHNVGADVLPGDTELSKKIGDIYKKETGYKIMLSEEWGKLKQTGTFKEWCDMRGLSFLEVETSKRWGSDWSKQKKAIEAVVGYLNSYK